MSVPDYNQRAEDHGSILILVKQVGHQLKQKTFNMIFDRISRQEYVRIQEPQTGRQRGLWLRFKKNYSLENNEWGDFQAHRKVLGLICIGQSDSEAELEQLSEFHDGLRQKFSSTLFDSRCAIFGMNSPQNIQKNNNSVVNNIVEPDLKSSNVEKSDSEPESKPEDLASQKKLEKLDPKHLEKLFPQKIDVTANNQTDLQYIDDDNANDGFKIEIFKTKQLDDRDSGVYEQTNEKSKPSPKNSPNVENNSRTRTSQFLFYKSVEQDYKQVEQDLYEYACSLFWVLESKRLDGRMYDKPSVEKLQLPVLCAPFEKKEHVLNDLDSKSQKKKILGRLKKHIGDLSLQAGLPIDALGHYTVAIELLKQHNDNLWLAAAYEGLCASSVTLLYPALHYRRVSFFRNASYHPGSPPLMNKSKHGHAALHNLTNGLEKGETKVQSCLTADGIIEKYEEAVKIYSRFKNAAVIETECSIKAVRVLILQEKCLEASNFLQNMILIALPISEDEKIERFSVLSDLYSEIGFHRKAAFFKRVAAMRCVAPQNENPNWSRCYHLILQTLSGYKLSLDPREFFKNKTSGWPGLQIQVLQELVGTARRMGNSSLAVRHMTFLLHAMFDHISIPDRKEFASQLETLTSKCEGAPVILALEDTGIIIPPVNLINLPRVKSFKLQNMAPHLRPIKMSPDHSGVLKRSVDFGPFIFSPLQMNRDKNTKDSTEMDFQWVEGDVCEVSLRLFNPLPFELKVNPMGLMADGIAFETFTTCLSLPPESGPYPVNLLGTPRATGNLLILGYTTHVLGVKSNCKLKDIAAIQKPHYSIQVVPALPQMQVTTSLPKSATFSSLVDSISHVVTSASVSLFAGQSQECSVSLTCSGNVAIEEVNFFLQSNLDKEMEKKFFTWSIDNLKAQLPILPTSSAGCTLYLNAIGDFVCHSKPKSKHGSQKSTPTHRASITESNSIQKQAHSEVLVSSSEALQMQMVEALLEIQYTGGPGMANDYCRQCAVAVNIEVIPSLVITKWDVLPAETPSHCYLVLDILNTTSHEMEVLYTNIKRMLIEAHETCRVPVPIERCPLSKLTSAHEENAQSPEDVCRLPANDPLNGSVLIWMDTRDKTITLYCDCQATLKALDKEANGVASISNIPWTPKMLDSICMSPVHWELFLNSECYKPQDEPTFLVGELVNISIVIHNQSSKPLKSLLLTVQGYQDYQNSTCNYRLEHKRAVVGCDNIVIEQILPQDGYRHNFGLLYFCPGVYKLGIQVSNNLQGGKAQASPSVTSLTNPSDSRHEWKCSPSIEINIVED